MSGGRCLPLAVALALAVAPLAAGAGARPHPSEESNGPWKARVTEAGTGAPIADVVVVALWEHQRRGMHGTFASLHDAREVITDTDGHFEIAANPIRLRGLRDVHGPRFLMFKGGYGLWRFKGQELWSHTDVTMEPSWVMERRAWTELTTTGATIVMPTLSGLERRRYLSSFIHLGYRIPASRIPRLTEAWNRERVALRISDQMRPPWDPVE
jgi:hypothetical protein